MHRTEEIGIDVTANKLVAALLRIAETHRVAILDSSNVGHLGSHLLIAGIDPIEAVEMNDPDPTATLNELESKVNGDFPCIFTLSYDFGSRLLGVDSRHTPLPNAEPDIYVAQFAAVIIHDYSNGQTTFIGEKDRFAGLRGLIAANTSDLTFTISDLNSDISDASSDLASNLTKEQYLDSIAAIRERIRDGDTYQTNLTQQFTATIADTTSAEAIFWRLRRDHPAPFAAYIQRHDSTVISGSPERFFRISEAGKTSNKTISTSPIKGTRPRGVDTATDAALRTELLFSVKDRAENTMIVDLLRNDLGRVCEYGSVRVEKLCDIEEHPTLFHLVSTVSGTLKNDASFADVLRALFPCGSITGAPKISTMRIIDEIEPTARGLSMGAIGYSMPGSEIDLSVAIRTMVIRGRTATFSVGGGIVSDSDPESEYAESMLKAKALFNAIGMPS